MRVGDRSLDVEEQPDSRLDAEALLVAEAVDVAAVDVFEHEVGLSRGRQARVELERVAFCHERDLRQPRMHGID